MSDCKEIKLLPEMKEVWQETLNWSPSDRQLKLFQDLYAEILKGNSQFNLTRITDRLDFWEKHLWDSLAGLIYLRETQLKDLQQPNRAIDIGTGAGFPGIPVGIFSEAIEVTLLDSTRKKITFLEDLIIKLQLNNCHALAGRAEEIGQNKHHRQFYDLAFVRAVGKAAVAAEYALPLLRIGGLAVLYRGHWQDEETLALEAAATQLGGKIDRIANFITPLSNSVRNCIYLRKIEPTSDRFPRRSGIPAQKPL
ncbi:MAG: 16S rRNA (guanine(527)-N(7))-methyltransferase RsmG [Prochloraceae cyanobacterium]|nr:16S rRNA (guanine(527)-N(7))-methyltransferase RsmG [Prochloraceae cyanobacterium]